MVKPLLQSSEPFYLQDDGFIDPDDSAVFHGFFGRNGGISAGIYDSLNCARASADDPQAVRENRGRVAAAAGTGLESLITMKQIHGNHCLVLHERPDNYETLEDADAMVTDIPGLALGVLTADCAPVLFYGARDGRGPVIGVAHAGWGGALKGVLENTVDAMLAMGVQIGDIRASIGPCIGPESYEVSDDFYQRFLEQDAANSVFFQDAAKAQHYMFNLPGYISYRLALHGVPLVSVRAVDTYFNEADFYSYRRSTHRQEPDYGRQISVICLREG